jgi:hypothetical protein
MSTSGSGIDFLLGYAEAEGALAEVVPEGAVLVLPQELRTALDLPEEIGLTADPETAREDGFLLVTTGHPLLMTAARTVLERGDVGCSSLPRPVGLPPTPSALEERAREQIHPDHGRIDVTGTPGVTNVMVLRVGALLTYSISIDERVQELEEVWVFADTGRAVPTELCERLRTRTLEPGVGPGIVAPDDAAVAGAHGLLCATARRRVDELARQTSSRLRGQLEVVDDYYGRVLSSIDERLQRVKSDRVTMLMEQADATKREWMRRRSEVADDLTPSFEVKPFRLHLVAVPSYAVQAAVRRGSRTYPLPLSYVPILSAYLPPQCPSCGSQAVLVAGKDQLGCRICMVPAPSTGAVVAERVEAGESAPTRPDGAEDTQKANKQDDGLETTPVPAVRRPPDRAAKGAQTRARATPKRSTGRVTPKGSVSKASGAQSGARVAMAFWSSVRSGELRPRDAVPNSPMRALLRLYGALGPAFVIGVGDAGRMTGITVSPVVESPDGLCSTVGELQRSGEQDTPFALFWRPGSRSSLLEVEGFPLEHIGPLLARRDEYGTICRREYSDFLAPPPAPVVELDPTAGVLLDRATRFAGLGYATRCMAAWWSVTEGENVGDLSIDHFDPAAAAACESVISKRLDMRVTVPALAERYECSVESVRRHLKFVQPVVRQFANLRW